MATSIGVLDDGFDCRLRLRGRIQASRRAGIIKQDYGGSFQSQTRWSL